MSVAQTSLLTYLTPNFTLDTLLNNFYFIRPWWLLAFFALFLVIFLLKKIRYYQSPWQHFLPPHLANALLENANNSSQEISVTTQSRYWLKPFIIGSCIIIALAGPAWQKLPQPVYQLERGAVLIMDMSYSMYATDVKPNRLTRARYKAIDLLKKINEGDVGLIAYAGDAFIISPLTQDIRNIELLLPSLSPDIMPVHGANALAALTLADQTLNNAGHISGDIYWFTDDIENEEMSDVYAWANENNHKVNILGVGTTIGAPIKLSSGKLLKDNKGAIVIPKLPESRLQAISKRSRGVYRTMTNDDSDIKALTAHLTPNLDDNLEANSANSESTPEQQSTQELQGDQYQEQGPWLLLIILPFLLSYFRRGSSILAISTLMPLTLLFSLITLAPTSYAAQPETNTASSTAPTENYSDVASSASQLWKNLWQTSDQQAQQHFQEKEYQQAADQFSDSQWQGSAHYKAGDYQQALDAFKQSDTAQSLYNQGNTLAQLQQVDEAIEAYKKALAKDPSLSDAKDNLAKLEELKKQQEQSKQDSEKSQDGQKEDQDKDQQDSDQQSQDESQGDKQQSDQEQDQQQQGDEQQQSEQSEEEKEQAEQQQQESNEAQEKKEQEEQEEQEEQANQAEPTDEEQKTAEEKALAQQATDNKAQETQQKHQQLLNKVTDDPYLLLRNKMRLEYQKRRHEGASKGEPKKW